MITVIIIISSNNSILIIILINNNIIIINTITTTTSTMQTTAIIRNLPGDWISGMTRCIPNEPGIPARPITLLYCKIKWLTGVLKLCLEILVGFIVPSEQKGFMKGRRMEDHLCSVHSLWMRGSVGAGLSIDFSKAFDSTSHCLMSVFLLETGVPPVWGHLCVGPIRFLVGNQLTDTVLTPQSGIKQGDTLSPTLFSSLTALLVHRGRFRTARAQSAHSYVVSPGNAPENHLPTEACMIHSKQHRGCRIQDPGTRGKHQTKTKNPWCTSGAVGCRIQDPGTRGYR